jgi:hypothetical protein
MKLRRLIEVEPLAEGRWSKIARSLFERLAKDVGRENRVRELAQAAQGRGTRGAWAARPSVGVAAALLVVASLATAGWAFRKTAAPSTDAPMSPSHIVTGSTASLFVVGSNAIAVAPASAIVVSGDDEHGVLAVVERGRVTFNVAPRRGRPPFVVQAGDVGVRVVGTQFTVARTGDGARVEVQHGVVEVNSAGMTAHVRDGETWPAGAANDDAQAVAGSDAAVPTAPVAPSGLAASSAPPAAAALPASSRRDAVAVDTRPRSAAPAVAPAPHAPALTRAGVDADDGGSVAPAPSVADVLSAQARFERAERFERSDPERALTLYRDVAADSGPWAMNALFASARLQADRGATTEAKALLGEYIRRYPQGPNAADARRMLDGKN